MSPCSEIQQHFNTLKGFFEERKFKTTGKETFYKTFTVSFFFINSI